ncbi:MAG: helix-hairpin-helix domain-containing protein [Bacillota bacterium]
MMMELLPFGVSASLVHKAYRAWGYSAIIAVKTNPYLLAEISPIGFFRADVIAENLGTSAGFTFSLAGCPETRLAGGGRERSLLPAC